MGGQSRKWIHLAPLTMFLNYSLLFCSKKFSKPIFYYDLLFLIYIL